VLLEKPMTLTALQAQELIRLSHSQRVHLVTSFPWHFTSHGQAARDLIASGALGQTKMISILMCDECLGLYQGLPWKEIFGDGRNPECEPEPYVEPGRKSYSDPAIAGGGQIFTQVSHVAAYLTFLTNMQATEVFARFDNGPVSIDVYNVVNVKLENGIIASISSTGATGKTRRVCAVTVYGDKGVLNLDLFAGTMSMQSMDGSIREFPRLSESQIYPSGEPVRHLIDLVLKRTTVNRSPGELGFAAMKIVEGACRSVQQRSNVAIPWW
jgi:predicted dehydrogenase